MTWNFFSKLFHEKFGLSVQAEKKMKISMLRQSWKYNLGFLIFSTHSAMDMRYVFPPGRTRTANGCISLIAQRMYQLKWSLLVALKLSSSDSQDTLSKEKCRMLQRKKSDVGKSPKQASSSQKEKPLELSVANRRTYKSLLENHSLQGNVVWDPDLGVRQPGFWPTFARWGSDCGGLWRQVVWVRRLDLLFSHCVALGNFVHLCVPQFLHL